MKTVDYLMRVKAQEGISSDYALAARLSVTRSAISHLQCGRAVMGDDTALKVAEILGLNPLEVIAAANAERAKTDDMRRVWTGLMEKVAAGFDVPLHSARLGPRFALTQ